MSQILGLFFSLLGGILLVGEPYSALSEKSREQRLDQGSCEPPEVDQEFSQVKQEKVSHISADIVV